MRVALSPPDVYEPAGHALQLLAPSPLYCSSLPHAEQALEFAAANSPAAHFEMTLVPSHAEPAGHTLQVVRVVVAPPEVNEPPGHTEQLPASFPLHTSSAPQAVQSVAVAPDAVPARHGEHDDALPAA